MTDSDGGDDSPAEAHAPLDQQESIQSSNHRALNVFVSCLLALSRARQSGPKLRVFGLLFVCDDDSHVLTCSLFASFFCSAALRRRNECHGSETTSEHQDLFNLSSNLLQKSGSCGSCCGHFGRRGGGRNHAVSS